MNNHRRLIMLIFIGGFIAPPVFWLLGLIFLGIVAPAELIHIALNPLLWVYVGGYNVFIYYYVNKKLDTVANFMDSPDRADLGQVQASILSLPKFFIFAEIVYCLVGPNAGMFGMNFLDGPKYLLGELIAVPIILLFSLPFYNYSMNYLESWTSSIPLSDEYGPLSLDFKLAINILVTVIGILTLLIVVNITLVTLFSGQTDGLRTAIIEKNLMIGLLGLAIVFLDFLIVRNIVRPIAQITRRIKDIDRTALQPISSDIQSLAQGDLTMKVTRITAAAAVKSTRDELGDLLGAIDGMQHSLKTIGQDLEEMRLNFRSAVELVAENAASINSASNNLTVTARQAGQATAQISSTIHQLANGSTQQAESISHTAASIEQMNQAIIGVAKGAQQQSSAIDKASNLTNQISEAIQQVASTAQTGASVATQAASTARSSASTVTETIQGMQTIKQKVGISAQKMQEMGKRSDQIGAIIETIDDIASQTNLLALNAAIEAARAGEYGKGFAVVADEVRKLAEKSASATKEITGLIKGIQSTVAETITAMDGSAHEVESGVERANQSSSALQSILQAVEDVNGKVGAIASASREIESLSSDLVTTVNAASSVVNTNKASTDVMNRNSGKVTQAIENIASVGEENSAAVEEVNASVAEIHHQVDGVASEVEHLSEIAANLLVAINQFKC